MLEIKLDSAKEEIIKREAKTVLVQIPEGLKQHLTKIVDELKTTGAEIFTSMDPCFGACDLPLEKMNALNADLLLHFGHAPIHRPQNVVYIPVYDKVEHEIVDELVKKTAEFLREKKIKKIGLCTHSQFLYLLDEVEKKLKAEGFEVFVGQGTPRIAHRGQILGCNYTVMTSIEPLYEAAVYFGEGVFHPIALAFSIKKPVYFADTSTKKIIDFSKERDRYMRKRFAAIALAKEAQTFGIIISTKTGQRYKQVALQCKELIEEHGKKAYFFTMDLVKEDYLLGINVDCLVNTACTRIVGDDSDNWKKNIVNPLELEIVFGKRKWEDFAFDVLY